MLINQFRILEKLYPDEAEFFIENRSALERGYTLHYDWIFEHISDDMPIEDCRFVLDVLDMYRVMTFSLGKLPENDRLKSDHFAIFRGFDGNEESSLFGYTRYFIVDLKRYDELRKNIEDLDGFNTHIPMREAYERMLREWKEVRKQIRAGESLPRNEIERILNATK